MPRLSVLAVRLSLLYLLLGFTLGALMLANKGAPFAPWVWRLLTGHMDILLFGFIIQLAIGVAYWILPRYRGGRRGNETAVWISVVLLNLGIWIVALSGWFGIPQYWIALGRALQLAAAFLFLLQIWRRIRPS